MNLNPVLRDDEQRLVRIHQLIPEQHLVVLERMDRRPREHRLVTRHKAEVDHYPVYVEAQVQP